MAYGRRHLFAWGAAGRGLTRPTFAALRLWWLCVKISAHVRRHTQTPPGRAGIGGGTGAPLRARTARGAVAAGGQPRRIARAVPRRLGAVSERRAAHSRPGGADHLGDAVEAGGDAAAGRTRRRARQRDGSVVQQPLRYSG